MSGSDTDAIVEWFGAGEENPGCDCGFADAVLRLAGGELLCASAARERGLPDHPTDSPAGD